MIYTSSNIRFQSNIRGLDYQNEKLKVFPNPNRGNFTIELPDFGNKNYTLEIRNVIGQKVWEEEKITQRKINLNLGNIASGLLVVALKENNSVIETAKVRIN